MKLHRVVSRQNTGYAAPTVCLRDLLERERERETETETETQTETERQTETDRQTETETERQRDEMVLICWINWLSNEWCVSSARADWLNHSLLFKSRRHVTLASSLRQLCDRFFFVFLFLLLIFFFLPPPPLSLSLSSSSSSSSSYSSSFFLHCLLFSSFLLFFFLSFSSSSFLLLLVTWHGGRGSSDTHKEDFYNYTGGTLCTQRNSKFCVRVPHHGDCINAT